MKLNREELLIGLIFGLCFIPSLEWYALLLAPVTSFLWALGGSEDGLKIYRRLGVPLVTSLLCVIVQHSWWPALSIPMGFAVLSLGYGIPTIQPVDAGSWLGQICFSLAKHDEELAELYCRSIIYILLAIAFMPCWIAK